MESAEVVVADDMAVYETVTALEQLSRGQVITTTEDGGEQIIQVYEEVVLPDETGNAVQGAGLVDQFVDVQEVEVGDGRSASPVKIDTTTTTKTGKKRGRPNSSVNNSASYLINVPGGANAGAAAALVPGGVLTELHCSDCGKLFKSKRSLFGHKKEKHSGISEVHHCPECGKSFGRKSNLKAHRESLHYGKKFPCAYCERIFTNRSSMNQHIKKTHVVTTSGAVTLAPPTPTVITAATPTEIASETTIVVRQQE